MYAWLVVPLKIFRILIDIVTDLIYGWFYDGDRTNGPKVPPISDVILLDPANVLAEKIRTRKISSLQVVEIYIKRILEVNGAINCLVDNRFEDAKREAREADQEVESSTDLDKLKKDKPFLGVPLTTKDCFAVTGLSYTAGLYERGKRKVKADFDADAVKLMRKAGAIILGVTNVSELCMWMESSNKCYGRSNNPYHIGRIVGGSSGGEAGLIASGASVFGIGSDVGGSIRMPAFFCGIFGHKPTTGLVCNAGQIPRAVGAVDTFLTTGPLCRYASDLLPMFEILLKDDVRQSNRLRLRDQIDLSQIKLYYMEDDGGSPFASPVHKDLKDIQLKLVKSLARTHKMAEPEKVSIKNLFHSFNIWSHKMSSEKLAPSFCQALNEYNGEINPFVEFAKWTLFKSSKHTLPALGLGIFEKFFSDKDPQHAVFLARCDQLRDEIDQLLGENGVLVYPTHSTPAPYHGQPLMKLITLAFNFAYTGVFNVTGHPVTQVPLGLGSWGVPLGMQLVCARNQDRLGLALAPEVERLFGGWVPPTGVV